MKKPNIENQHHSMCINKIKIYNINKKSQCHLKVVYNHQTFYMEDEMMMGLS